MSQRTCCVGGCDDKSSRRYAIPKDKIVQQIWINRIGNQKLYEIDDHKILKNYTVCQNHFHSTCFNPDGRLIKFALPSINLPGTYESENCFYRPEASTFKTFVTPEKIREALKGSASIDVEMDTEVGVINVQKTYQSTSKRRKLFTDENVCAAQAPDCARDYPSTSSMAILSQSISHITSHDSHLKVNPVNIPPKKKSKGILYMIGVTRQKFLTPREKQLFQMVQKFKKIANNKKVRKMSIRKKLQFFSRRESLFQQLSINDITLNFIKSQINTQKFKPRGRRFTLNDKILALSIYKQSGKCYRFLSRIFSLPSRKIIMKILNHIPFDCGINDAILNHLKTVVDSMNKKEKFCVLMFDEVSLQVGLKYNQQNDAIDGFVDMGGELRRARFADHALVFMIKGIFKKWKMPICFTFCEGTTSTPDLLRLLKDIIRKLRDVGLYVIASISDQGATNQAAINQLLMDTRASYTNQGENQFQGYVIDGEEVIHLYDFPHLIKGIRNGLLSKNLCFIQDDMQKVASWQHVINLYKLDKNRGAFSQFNKLGDEHVLPNKIKKMRVKNCTQVFSHTVSTAMHVAAQYSKNLSPQNEFYLDPKASETADLLLFFDKLFDSINGFMFHPPPGKTLRSVVSDKSQHLSFWYCALPIIESMYFRTHENATKRIVIPSIKNWSFSIHGMIYLTKKIFSLGFKFFSPRTFNQDPIENYFSCLRSYGFRDTNPTCSSFITTHKSLLINNLVSPHSVGSNCEEDESDGILDNLRSFITKQSNLCFVAPTVSPPIFPETVLRSASFLADYTTVYVAGFVVKKILSHGKCDDCYKSMTSSEALPEHILIAERQYPGATLHHPSTMFSQVFKNCTQYLLSAIVRNCIIYKLKRKLIEELTVNFGTVIENLFCLNHRFNYQPLFIKTIVNIVLHSYLNNINNILKGKDLRRVDQDPLTCLAFKKYQKKYKR